MTKFRLIGCALVAMCLGLIGVESAFADTPVQFNSLASFDSVFDSLRTAITTVVVAAIGLGLSIWGTKWMFRVVKSMGR